MDHSGTEEGEVELDDGRRLTLLRAGPSHDDAVRGLRSPQHGSPVEPTSSQPRRRPAVSDIVFIAVTPHRGVVGAVWLEADEGADRATLGLAVQRGFRHLGAEAALAKRAAQEARGRGYTRVSATVPHVSSDVLASIRSAGMKVLSCVSFGGTSEVELDV